jgi:hypothetical protein
LCGHIIDHTHEYVNFFSNNDITESFEDVESASDVK